MAIYIYYYDEEGNLIDIERYCSELCLSATIAQREMKPGKTHEIMRIIAQETDYDEFCEGCADFISHGLQCPQECRRPEIVEIGVN